MMTLDALTLGYSLKIANLQNFHAIVRPTHHSQFAR